MIINSAVLVSVKADLVKGEVRITFATSLTPSIVEAQGQLYAMASSQEPLRLSIDSLQLPLFKPKEA